MPAVHLPCYPLHAPRQVLSVHPLLLPGMRREYWASEQFEVTKRLHKGYASEVYKVGGWGNAPSGERWGAILAARSKSRRAGIPIPILMDPTEGFPRCLCTNNPSRSSLAPRPSNPARRPRTSSPASRAPSRCMTSPR